MLEVLLQAIIEAGSTIIGGKKARLSAKETIHAVTSMTIATDVSSVED